MSSRRKQALTRVLRVSVLAVFFGILQWRAEPRVGHAWEPGDPPSQMPCACIDGRCPPCGSNGDPIPDPEPDVSLIFVIDSSTNMFPHIGPSYFDLAKEGIIEFLSLSSLPLDGTFEIAVIQYPKKDAPGYLEDVHWIAPAWVYSESVATLIDKVAYLTPSGHHSASLMEEGINHASYLIHHESNGSSHETDYHIILLTTGEYRLPPPCPPECYSRDDCPPDCAVDTAPCYGGELCNRACHIRYFAAYARQRHQKISAIRLGPDWHNYVPLVIDCEEPEDPYLDPPNYCAVPSPPQPDRDGFLREITNVTGCFAGEEVGMYARINPFINFGCASGDCKPGTARDVAKTLASWLCASGYSPDGDGDQYADLCDNCPDLSNPRQRDCDRNGQGDLCQYHPGLLCTAGQDTDCDGIADADDRCEGGDDCLVARWLEEAECPSPNDPDECDCACDHDISYDACEAAIELAPMTLPQESWPDWTGIDDDPANGIADCCEGGGCDCPDGADDCACGTSPCSCNPIPHTCDIAALPASSYIEPFSTEGQFVNDIPDMGYVNDQGWWASDADNALAASTASHVQVIDSLEIPDDHMALELSVDDDVETNGTYSWFVEGPGFHLPLGPCHRTVCDNKAWRGPWSVIAIELDLLIDNEDNGPTYDLYVFDPCVAETDDAKRIHLRFTDHPSEPNKGQIEYELPGYVLNNEYVSEYAIAWRTYPMNAWFTLKLGININQLYQNHHDYGCLCCADTRTVNIFMSDAVPLGSGDFDEVEYQAYELGRIIPEVPRGVQLRFDTNNKEHDAGGSSTDRLLVGEIRIRQSDTCEWWQGNDICDRNDPSETCACGWSNGHNMWHCTSELCGDGTVDADEGEECEPPNTEHCDGSCHWICGDGVVQEGEDCEWPCRMADGSHYCTCDCYLVIISDDDCFIQCGNGIVETFGGFCPPEECDDGNDEDGDGCSSDCLIEYPG